MERKIISLTLRDQKQAEWVREQTRANDIIVKIKKKKWAWAWNAMARLPLVLEGNEGDSKRRQAQQGVAEGKENG